MPACRVLVVDDDADTLSMLEFLLRYFGFDVAAAGSGAQALDLLSSRPADVVLTDMSMPGIDGVELTRRLREDPRFRQIPIIVLSALPLLPETLQGRVDAFLQKPVDLERLLAAIRQVRPVDD